MTILGELAHRHNNHLETDSLQEVHKPTYGALSCHQLILMAELLWSWLGDFLGIAAMAYIPYGFLNKTDLLLLIGSLGAAAGLIYRAIKSPPAPPRNFLGGISFRPSSA